MQDKSSKLLATEAKALDINVLRTQLFQHLSKLWEIPVGYLGGFIIGNSESPPFGVSHFDSDYRDYFQAKFLSRLPSCMPGNNSKILVA
jgi:hypothetical protein